MSISNSSEHAQRAIRDGISFDVDPVTSAADLLPECRMHEELRWHLDSDIESCSDYHSNVVKQVGYQPLLAAVYMAFSQHRPLVLSPDAVWITIAQGVAHHMALHGEALRSRFVAHSGKLELQVKVQDWVAGSPENPWNEAFAGWSGLIRAHVGASLHDTLKCDFSTTGPVEQAVGDIVIMDIFERYFEYVVVGICGIPRITLEGTPADWVRLHEKVKGLRIFDLDWWLDSLKEITSQFAAASAGEVDVKHWQSICKLQNAYGGDIINGWICRLFPYIRDFSRGPCRTRNPIFELGNGFKTLVAPSGLSQVPFLWKDPAGERQMEVIGGLTGVSQDAETMALRPMVGWAVRPAAKMDVVIARVKAQHHTTPRKSSEEKDPPIPTEFAQFYSEYDSADLFGLGDNAALRILPKAELLPIEFGENATWHGLRFKWRCFGQLRGGGVLAFHPHPYIWAVRASSPQIDWFVEFSPICVIRDRQNAAMKSNPVIAMNFADFLGRFLSSGGQLYWEEPGFVQITEAILLTHTTYAENRSKEKPSTQ